MKQTAFALLLLTAAIRSHAAGPADALAAFHAALARGDQEQARALLSRDVVVYESGHVERTREEYAGHHLPADIAFAASTARKVLQQTVREHGDVAVIWEETETTGSYQGKPVNLLGTGTTVLEKRGEQWVITHVHWSSRKNK
jgi:hypothetical protein